MWGANSDERPSLSIEAIKKTGKEYESKLLEPIWINCIWPLGLEFND